MCFFHHLQKPVGLASWLQFFINSCQLHKDHPEEKAGDSRNVYMDVSLNGGTQQPWGFPTKNDHFGVFWGYHHLRKHPYK